jgi:hypothetical protein
MDNLLIDGRIDALRAALTTTHSAQWRRLYEQCDWYRQQQPPTEHPTASITYFGPAAANLALAYRLTGQRGYLDEAWRWISTCVAFPHWGKAKLPDHDLDAGWLLHGLSLAYSWLRDDLGPERAGLLRDKLELQGQRLHDYAVETEGTWWSSSFWQNHHWICHTGLAAAGYALDRPEWTKWSREAMETVLALMPDDGSDHEGVVYWRYGVPWLAIYADLLQHAEGADLWEHGGFLRNTFGWRLHQCAPGFEENVDHGDCHDRRSGHSVALYYKLASAYGIGEAQWLADRVASAAFWREAYASGVKPGVMPEAYLELLWYDPVVIPVDPATTVDTTVFFPDLGQLVSRTGWHDSATFVSFKAAPGGGHKAWQVAEGYRREHGWETLNAGHHHPDAGSFVLASQGAFLAVDDGYCNRKRAAHHNLVLVDGQGWSDEDRYNVYDGIGFDRQPRQRDVLAEAGFAHATAETAAMFAHGLGVRRCDRTLIMTPKGRLVLLDELEADDPREWTVLLHSDWPAEDIGTWPVAIRSGPALAWVHTFGPVTVTSGVTAIEANPTSSTPSLSISKTLHTLRVNTDRVARARLLTVLEPTTALTPVAPCAVELANGVDFGDELVLASPLAHRIEGPGVTARAAAVIVSGDRVAVVAATQVTHNGVVVHQSSDPWTGVLR